MLSTDELSNCASTHLGAAVPGAPAIDKIPPFFNHPGFIDAMVERVRQGLESLPGADVVYTAHSIPVSMAQSSPYEQQLRQASAMVMRSSRSMESDCTQSVS